jgi:hypothetical protein
MGRRRRAIVADAEDLPSEPVPLTRGQQALVDALVACIVTELQQPPDAAPVAHDVNPTTPRQTLIPLERQP